MRRHVAPSSLTCHTDAMAGSPPNPLEALTLDQLRERGSSKWRRYDPDVLPLFVAEMDVPLAPPITEVLERAVRNGDTGYPEGPAYHEAFAAFADRHWGWSPNPSAITGVPDVITGYRSILTTLTQPGDSIVINPPVYPPFAREIIAAGRVVENAPLGADGRLDLGALEEAFARARKSSAAPAYLLCSPHNPTGVVHTRDELTAVAGLASTYGIRVVVDEIHAPLVYRPHRFVPYLSIDDSAYSVTAASKAFNLPGLKGALLIAGTSAGLSDYRRTNHDGASYWGALAQTAALTHGDSWLESLITALDDQRHLLATLMESHLPTAQLLTPESTYLAWMDCRALGVKDDPAAHFLEHARVAVNSGPTFGLEGVGFVRINFATSAAIVTEAVTRMADSLAAPGA